jgi:hypothetical protein
MPTGEGRGHVNRNTEGTLIIESVVTKYISTQSMKLQNVIHGTRIFVSDNKCILER